MADKLALGQVFSDYFVVPFHYLSTNAPYSSPPFYSCYKDNRGSIWTGVYFHIVLAYWYEENPGGRT